MNSKRRRRIILHLWLHKKQRTCAYCGCKLRKREATIDHIIPVSKGGTNNPGNYILACSECNSVKGNSIIPPRIECLKAYHKQYISKFLNGETK